MSANELAVQSVRQFVVKTGEPNDLSDQANTVDISSVPIYQEFPTKEFWTHSPTQLLVRLDLGTCPKELTRR